MNPTPKSSTDKFFDFKEVRGFAEGYLKTYYQQPPANDERAAIGFLVRMLREFELPRTGDGLVEHFDAACGPTLHHAIPATPHVDRIWMGDYVPENLEQVRKWWRAEPGAHSWSQYTQLALALEGGDSSLAAIEQRETLTRQKMAGLLHCDFLRADVLDPPRQFSSVGCFYGTEEVGINQEGWEAVVQRVTQLVAPGGLLILAILGETDSYAVHDSDGTIRRLPAAYLAQADVARVIHCGPFDLSQTRIEVASIEGQQAEGVNQVILVATRRRP